MSAQAKPNEPSMEEILASIRRIISDDEVKPAEAQQPAGADADTSSLLAGAAAVPEPAPLPEPEPEDDILDLAAEAEPVAPPAAIAAAPEPAPPAAAVDDLDFFEATDAVAAAPAPEPPRLAMPMQAAAPQPAPAFDMAQLLSDQASSSVTSAFGQLAHTVLSNNARTLEDLVKDMLKPMLKSWLDDNLPVMVERLVRAEIERVARGGRS